MATTDWERVRNHSSDLLTQDLILGGFHAYCDMTRYGASFKTPFVRYEHETGDIFWSRAHMDDLRALELSNEQAGRLVADLQASIDEYRIFVQDFATRASAAKPDPALVREWFDRSQRIVPLIAYFVFEESLARQLEREGASPHDIPSAKTDVTRAAAEITELAGHYQEVLRTHAPVPADLDEALGRIAERYGYLGMKYFSGTPWTRTDVYGMAAHGTATNTAKEQKPVSASKALGYLAELLRMRTEKWEMMCLSIFHLRSYLIRAFGDRVRYEDLLSHRVDEVLQIVAGDYAPALKRHDAFTLTVSDDGYQFDEVSGRAKAARTNIENSGSVRGMVAHRGLVRGTARIVLTPKDAHKILPGDILIASMSTPDFLPAMQRAAAFVTDIGGITSHAAIVSREMRKPCIIGTEVATKTFRDGDLVEVDADKGVVRIIGKA